MSSSLNPKNPMSIRPPIELQAGGGHERQVQQRRSPSRRPRAPPPGCAPPAWGSKRANYSEGKIRSSKCGRRMSSHEEGACCSPVDEVAT